VGSENREMVGAGDDHKRTPGEHERAMWERPQLRRLAANMAEGGGKPCNDGSGGGGCGNPTPHS